MPADRINIASNQPKPLYKLKNHSDDGDTNLDNHQKEAEIRKALVPRHNPDLVVSKKVKINLETIGNLVDTKPTGGLNGYPTLIVGHAGVGKNQLIGEVAFSRNQPLIKINCSGDMRTSSLLGRIAPVAGKDGQSEFVWQDGLLIEGIRKGYWVDLDEINSLDADILFAIHGLIDDGFMTLANNSEIIYAHPDFRLFATMNPISYYGVKTLNQALIDRFAVLEMDFDEEVDKKLIGQLNQPDEVKTSLTNVINNIRKSYEEGEVTQNFGHRTVHNVVVLAKVFELSKALEMTYTNKLPDGEKAVVKTIVNDLTSLIKTVQKQTQSTTRGGGKATSPQTGRVVDGVDVDKLAQILADKGQKH
jgi:MoxR-like ATPase